MSPRLLLRKADAATLPSVHYRWKRDRAEPVDLNAVRLEATLSMVEQARNWLKSEVLGAEERLSHLLGWEDESFAAHYGFTLGQIDRAMGGIHAEAVHGTGDSLSRVRRIRRRLGALLEECERNAQRHHVPTDGLEAVRVLAFRRAVRELRSLLAGR